MKRTQRNIAAILGFVIVASLATADAHGQATQHYPPSPRVYYAWRPVTTDVAVQPAVYRSAVLPPPGVTPVTAYQPVAAPAQPTLPAKCCGQTYAAATYASEYPPTAYPQATAYPQTTYAPASSGVKAYRPLVHLSAPPPIYTVGQGLWGQSKVYIPNQHIRNTVRYLTP
jgi:hypothetical protein